MGLDVYLKCIEDIDTKLKIEKEASEKREKIWNEELAGRNYEEASQAEKDRISALEKKMYEELGCGEWGEYDVGSEGIEFDSAKYPEHYFKVGYFRSSYNGAGINHVLGNILGDNSDLYYIFNIQDDDYYVRPDWKLALERVREVIERYKDALKDGRFAVAEISSFHAIASLSREDNGDYKKGNFYMPPRSEFEAFSMFKKRLKKYNKQVEDAKEKGEEPFQLQEGKCHWYSNIEGSYYFGKPMEVMAVLPGIAKYSFQGPVCMFVIYKIEDDGEIDWYLKALEIVEETILWVLDQGETSKYVLGWSG